jgi:hypothetical protein
MIQKRCSTSLLDSIAAASVAKARLFAARQDNIGTLKKRK